MRKFFIIVSAVLTVLGVLFTMLPMGTIPVMFLIPGFVFALLALLKSAEKSQKKFPFILLVILCLNFVAVMVREFCFQDKVVVDTQFEQQKQESKQQAQQELEELDSL